MMGPNAIGLSVYFGFGQSRQKVDQRILHADIPEAKSVISDVDSTDYAILI